METCGNNRESKIMLCRFIGTADMEVNHVTAGIKTEGG